MSVSTNDMTRALQQRFETAGFTPVEPPVLADAAIFLNRSGEDIRRRTYIFNGPDGAELALRPDLTVPTALTYIDGIAPAAAKLTYAGPAFRVPRPGEPAAAREAAHVGFEWFGGAGDVAEDVAVSRETFATCEAMGLTDYSVKIGHVGLGRAVIDALPLTDALRDKLKRRFSSPKGFAALLASLAHPEEAQEAGGVAAALAALPDEAARRAMMDEILSLANVQPAGGRSLEDIAARLLKKADALAAPAVSTEVLDRLQAFVGLNGPAAETLDGVRALVGDLGDAVAQPLESLAAVLEAIGDRPVTFSTTFGRAMDYYTGIVFEVRSPAVPEGAIAGGGRYDGLVAELGGPVGLSSIGAMIRPDRLVTAIDGAK